MEKKLNHARSERKYKWGYIWLEGERVFLNITPRKDTNKMIAGLEDLRGKTSQYTSWHLKIKGQMHIEKTLKNMKIGDQK